MTASSPDILANALLEIIYELGSNEYAKSRIPNELDRSLYDVLEKCVQLDPEDIDVVGAEVDSTVAVFLECFGERMASLCVRENNLQHSFIGLFAVTLTFYNPPDYRDLLGTLVLLYNSVLKIGKSPEELFARVEQAIPKAAATFRDFLSRDPEINTLEAMLYIETEGPDGFLYKKVMPWER